MYPFLYGNCTKSGIYGTGSENFKTENKAHDSRLNFCCPYNDSVRSKMTNFNVWMGFLCKNGIYGTGSGFFGPRNKFYGLKNTSCVPGSIFCKTGSDNFFTGSEIFKAGSEANDLNKNSHVLKNDFSGAKIA